MISFVLHDSMFAFKAIEELENSDRLFTICSQRGNVLFPSWERFIPNVGIIFLKEDLAG